MRTILLLSIAFTACAVDIQISNNLQKTIWVGILGQGGHPNLADGGFVLPTLAQRKVFAAGNWSGFIWARTHCNYKTKVCETGSCGRKIQCSGATPTPPVTLVQLKLKSLQLGQDQYGVSLIDGFNVPAKIEPLYGKGDCYASSCIHDINAKCHEELAVIGEEGDIVGCQSSCNRYMSLCCRNRLRGGSCNITWPIDSTPYFKSTCPEAMDYTFLDANKAYICSSQIYSISFGQNN